MTALFKLSRRSLDELEEELVAHAQRINAAEYAFLELVREFDIRQGWRPYQFNNCAEWLNMKCGIVVGTAREKVRVASALFDLPRISRAFASGELSYSKVRSLSRVATPHNEAQLLEYAQQATAEQVQRRCQQMHNADRAASTRDVNEIHRGRFLRRSVDGSGRMTISIELTEEAGALVMAALERAMAEADASRDASTAEDEASFPARQADALVDMARAYLAGDSAKTASPADHYQVVVHVDEAALRAEPVEGARSDLPIESVRRLCCDAGVVVVTEDDKGNPLDLGRKHRVVQPALRRALIARDRHCCYPGCAHTRWLEAHHVMHWIDGGKTNLDNTLLLCSAHHRRLHEGGFRIKPNHTGEWYFETAAGKRLCC
ncbi:MAG: DUF222 domain-containing protein [Gammaproteobacteria bacterium]|jgi:hypothetical protein|nr:DUF222 domain-containing protein [Gammaproteobacteria bacterium]MBP6482115.1 DUF222 domain-containing protein [Pseudomonadales bacterium]MBP7911463.1 DUF222 domain-containing protein [Pseudomonadales bacterium]